MRYLLLLGLFCTGCQEKEEAPADLQNMVLLEEEEGTEWDMPADHALITLDNNEILLQEEKR